MAYESRPLAKSARIATLEARLLQAPFTNRAFLLPLAELGAVALGINVVPIALTAISAGAIIVTVAAAYVCALNSPRLLFGEDVDVERYLDDFRRAQSLYSLLGNCFPIAFAYVLYAFTKENNAIALAALSGGCWLFMKSQQERTAALRRSTDKKAPNALHAER